MHRCPLYLLLSLPRCTCNLLPPPSLAPPAAVSLVEENWTSGRMAETLANLEDLRKAGAEMPPAVVAIVVAALDYRRQADVSLRLPPFVEVFLAAVEGGQLTAAELAQGALELARTLHILAEDFAKVRPPLGGAFIRRCTAPSLHRTCLVCGNAIALEQTPSSDLPEQPRRC